MVLVRLEVNELDIKDISISPLEFSLNSIYPNPFNSTATIQFTIASSGNVTLQMFDMTGGLVKNLINGNNLTTGEYNIIVEAADLPAGSYSVRLQQNHNIQTQTINLVK